MRTSGERPVYGLGWYADQFQGTNIAWHQGFWNYFHLYVKFLDPDYSLIILTNSTTLGQFTSSEDVSVMRYPVVLAFYKLFIMDMGLGDRVVGITKFCIHPEAWFRSKARVGGTKQVDMDKVRALKPDLIIGNKEENTQADIEALEQEYPVWMSDVRDLDGALDMIRRVGLLTGTTRRSEALVSGIERAFAGLRPLTPPRSAAYLIWRG